MATITGINSIDSLLAGEDYRWNRSADYGTPVTVTYSFMESAPSYADPADTVGFAPLSTTARSAARQALATWSALTGLTFTEVSDSGDGGQIRLGSSTQPDSAGFAYFPGTTDDGGDVYMANNLPDSDYAVGGYAYSTLIHELGHALGLKHPGNYNALGGGGNPPYLPAAEDTYLYSLMSYEEWDYATEPVQPMLYDVAAIQFLYGTNSTTNAGDTVYTYDASLSVQVIWDGAGTDTLSGERFSTDQTLNLTGGTFSTVGGQMIAITANAVIENATGGSGNDTLTGNGSANILRGNAGNDSFIAGGGDTVEGGAGSDTLTLTDSGGTLAMVDVETLIGGSSTDLVFLGSAQSTLAVSAIEMLVGGTLGEWVTLGDGGQTIYLAAIETLIGGAGSDHVSLADAGTTMILTAVETLSGGNGTDRIRLGDRGNTITAGAVDVLFGGDGGDWVNLADGGQAITMVGVETLIGGGGTDRVRLGDRGNTTILAAIEVLDGGDGGDFIRLGDRGSTMTIDRIDTLVGGASLDAITLSGPASLTIAAVEAVTGSSGSDSLRLGDRGNTLLLSGIETLTAGDGADSVALRDAGETFVFSGVETMTGGAGTDNLRLGDTGNAVTLVGVEIIGLGEGTDAVTLVGGDTTIVALASADGGSAAGSASGADSLSGFETGRDSIALTGSLRSMVDTAGNGITVSVRSGGEVRASDDVVLLSPTVSALTDTDFGAFRTALGTVESGATAVVAARTASATGLYVIADDGDGTIAASEVRLLMTVDSLVAATDFAG